MESLRGQGTWSCSQGSSRQQGRHSWSLHQAKAAGIQVHYRHILSDTRSLLLKNTNFFLNYFFKAHQALLTVIFEAWFCCPTLTSVLGLLFHFHPEKSRSLSRQNEQGGELLSELRGACAGSWGEDTRIPNRANAMGAGGTANAAKSPLVPRTGITRNCKATRMRRGKEDEP